MFAHARTLARSLTLSNYVVPTDYIFPELLQFVVFLVVVCVEHLLQTILCLLSIKNDLGISNGQFFVVFVINSFLKHYMNQLLVFKPLISACSSFY